MRAGAFSFDALLRSSTLSIGASAFNYATLLILARILDQEAFAHYLYVIAWGMIAVLVIDCAAEQCMLHFSRVISLEPIELWGRLLGLKLIVLGLVVAGGSLLGALTALRFPAEFLLLVLPAFYTGPVYESRQRNVEYAGVMFAERVAVLVSAGMVVWAGWSVSALFIAYFAVSGASLAFQLHSLSIRAIDFKPDGHWGRYLRGYSAIYLVLVAQLFYGNISRLIIDWKLGALAFGAATLSLQIINLMSLIQTQVDKHLRPSLINAVMNRDVGSIKLYARNYGLYYVVPLAIAAVGLSLFSAPVMGLLFGERWRAAGEALRVLSPLLVTIGCLRFVDILVVALDLGKLNLVVNVAAAACLSLMLMLMPEDAGLKSYLPVIVIVQVMHVMVMGGLVFRKVGALRS